MTAPSNPSVAEYKFCYILHWLELWVKLLLLFMVIKTVNVDNISINLLKTTHEPDSVVTLNRASKSV
jgi:hypothetical protein